MIEPKFREFIIPLTALRFKMRFWISHETNLLASEIGPAMLNLKKKIDEMPGSINARPKDAEIIIQAFFAPENRVTAYEILNERGVGIVAYVEWP